MTMGKTKRLQSVLGLTLADGELRACHVTQAKGRHEVVRTASATLSLDVLHPEPELVGREIKNHLDTAGIRERHCVVALPARWLMTQHSAVPELSPEDTASFLQIEAEKYFPVDPAQLQTARSEQKTAANRYVTQLAVRREQLDQLAAALKAAGLKPVSFTLGLAALAETGKPKAEARILLAAEPAGVTMLVTAGGGIAAFRTFEPSFDGESGEKLLNTAAVSRELRITLEQVPADLREGVRQLFITGDSALARQLAEGLAPWARAAVTIRPWKSTILNSVSVRLPIGSSTCCSSVMRLACENSGFLDVLTPTATTSVSTILQARSITSRWPFVSGSNEPG